MCYSKSATSAAPKTPVLRVKVPVIPPRAPARTPEETIKFTIAVIEDVLDLISDDDLFLEDEKPQQ